jgi:pimeloyl-ACP methyl ester carboxylesterase
MRVSEYPPEPPAELPPARTVHVKGRGEFFVRDSGLFEPDAEGPTVMLLHGWMASADLNWVGAYRDLIEAGYRVLAIDHRGHGRGLRPLVSFRLSDCAADAAGVLRSLGLAPALVVGYSMGGAVAQLMTREQPDVVAGVILSGTAQHWQEPALRRYWLAMGAMGLGLAVFPSQFWSLGVRRSGIPESPRTAWLESELMRHSARDVAEAGRELGRFDSRPWLKRLEVPAAVVLTSRDDLVPPKKQRELAQALEAEIHDAPIRHIEVTTAGAAFNQPLLRALEAVRNGHRARAA